MREDLKNLQKAVHICRHGWLGAAILVTKKHNQSDLLKGICIYIYTLYTVVYTYRSWWLHTFHKCWLPDTRWKLFLFFISSFTKSPPATWCSPYHFIISSASSRSARWFISRCGTILLATTAPKQRRGEKRDGRDATHRRVRGAKDVVLDGSVVNMVTKVRLNHGINTDETFHCFSFFGFQYSSAINDHSFWEHTSFSDFSGAIFGGLTFTISREI